MTTRIPLVRLVILTTLALVTAMWLGAAAASAGTSCAASESVCGPDIMILKHGPAYVAQGEQATYTFDVSNEGDRDLFDVVASDDLCSPLTETTSPADDDGILSPDETWTYTCTYTPAGEPGDDVVNTATATANYEFGKGQTASIDDTNQHTTAIAGLKIVKTVDEATADPFDVLHYTVTITHTGPDDWSYDGFVTDDQWQCSLATDDETSQGNFWLLDPGESITYTCSMPYDPDGDEQDGSDFTNTACFNAKANKQEVVIESDPNVYWPIHACSSATTSLASHSVSGQVFEDMNADGARQAGEPALAGIVIYADTNGNGVRDEGEPSATSDGQGNYTIGVPLGQSTIREDVPGGFTCSFPAGCAYPVDLPKNDPPPEQESPRSLQARATDPSGLDFGDWRPATVSGTVVADANGNGTRDAGEGIVSGALVFADLNGDGVLDQGEPSTSSGADGSYVIGGLKPGGYVIRQVVPAGLSCTGPAGCNHNVTLVSNGSATGRDFLDTTSGQLVLPARIIPGRASMTGRSGCVNGAFNARVRGARIQRVMFFLDGRYKRALTKPKSGAFAYRVDVNKLRVGRHQVVARITFASSSRTKNKTLRLSFQRCAAQLRAPQFTG